MMEVLGKPIIQRERDEQDKRVILYRVQEFSKAKTIEIPEIMMD
jgi:DNA-binding MarR family transcriptional regulator